MALQNMFRNKVSNNTQYTTRYMIIWEAVHASHSILMSSNQPSFFSIYEIFHIADENQNKTITKINIDKLMDR